jgi:uncharacterized protein (UPF0548 family)
VRLQGQSLTYDAVGRALTSPPAGYAHFSRTRRLPATRSFDDACDLLLGWQAQARSGLRVAASSARIELGAVVIMRFGLGPASLPIPCRVVSVFDDPDRRGFAYGTLPGHPETGEEAFVLQRRPDGAVDFTIAAFSRPSSIIARVGGPVTARVQRWMTGRYLHALD